LGQNLATFEGAMVLATISKEFDLTFAPGYHETVPMIDLGTKEKTPLYLSSLTLPMVRLSLSLILIDDADDVHIDRTPLSASRLRGGRLRSQSAVPSSSFPVLQKSRRLSFLESPSVHHPSRSPDST
jgi:hypothetical protein